MHRSAKALDERAFADVVERTHALVWSVCLSILQDRALADEAMQEVFVRLWRRGPTADEPARLRAWLRQVARRRAIDLQRRQRRTRRDRDAAIPASTAPHPESTAHVAIAEALASLPDEQRELLIRFHIDDEPSRVVAEELGVSDAAARKRLSRAREALRDAYEDQLRAWARPVQTAGVVVAAVLATSGVARAGARGAVLAWTAGIGAVVAIPRTRLALVAT